MSGRWANSNRSARLPLNWAKLRRAVLARDRGICYLCGQPGADAIDHIVRGDDNALTNLAAVHDRNPPHCHRQKTQAEAQAAAAAIRAMARRPQPRHPGLISPDG